MAERVQKRDFDKEAAAWDDNPVRLKLADDVAKAVREEVSLTPEMDVLDFGCGTGLLTLRLQPIVRSITGVDSSGGMLDVLQGKVERLKLANVHARLLDVENGGRLEGPYHLIVSSMTLHHIRDIAALLRRFRDAAAPGGRLCLADLDSEQGRFHGNNSQGVFHNGFERAALLRELAAAGFTGLRDRTAATVTKPGPDGKVQAFTIFLIAARNE